MENTTQNSYKDLINAVSEFVGYTDLKTLNDNLNAMFDSVIRNQETDYTKETLSDMNFDIKNILNLAIRLKELNEFIINEDNRILYESEKTKKIA
jgi:hypothetical protein